MIIKNRYKGLVFQGGASFYDKGGHEVWTHNTCAIDTTLQSHDANGTRMSNAARSNSSDEFQTPVRISFQKLSLEFVPVFEINRPNHMAANFSHKATLGRIALDLLALCHCPCVLASLCPVILSTCFLRSCRPFALLPSCWSILVSWWPVFLSSCLLAVHELINYWRL
jgi:hypothetical protein